MRKALLMFAVLSALSVSASADELAVPEPAAPENSAPAFALPTKGMKMAAVQQQYGEPVKKHPAAGGGSRKQPPIRRWDYSGFSVFFEHSHVVDVVTPAAPAPVQNTLGLENASPMTEAPAEPPAP